MKYWFKRRRYGFGWFPVTVQGWLTLVVYVAVLLVGSWFILGPQDNPPVANVIYYLVFVLVSVAALWAFILTKAPKPKWRWGKKPDDNPEEDF